MRTEELDYHLPSALIATRPAHPRDSARLMVVSRSDPKRVEHRLVRDLPEVLGAGDRLVFNATRVLPARLVGSIDPTGGAVEGLYLRDDGVDEAGRPVWVCMVKVKRQRPGRRIALAGSDGTPCGVTLTLLDRAEGEGGAWRVSVEAPDMVGRGTPEVLDRCGRTPLPPYILGARKERGEGAADGADRGAYQTVYARPDQAASVAAPTAGLHFTPELLRRLDAAGVERAEVLLSVGAGTFKPVEAEHLEDHPMHEEWCSLWPAGPRVLERPTGRLVAVGTTAARTLESFAMMKYGPVPEAAVARGSPHPGPLPGREREPEWLATRLLIAPGHRWRCVEALVTNFHLPRSTLLALVAAMFPEGMERVRAVYGEAIARGYRFYSYGDAMVVVE